MSLGKFLFARSGDVILDTETISTQIMMGWVSCVELHEITPILFCELVL